MLVTGEVKSVEQYKALKSLQRNEESDAPEQKSEISVQEVQSHIDQKGKNSDASEQELEYLNTESKKPSQDLQILSEQLGGESDNAERSVETTITDLHATESLLSERSSVPYRLPDKQFNSFKESVADLKDPNKDCSCTPDIFLAEYSGFIRRFVTDIQWYTTPQYELVFPALTPIQIDYLHSQTRIICDAAKNLLKQVERMNQHELQEKALSTET